MANHEKTHSISHGQGWEGYMNNVPGKLCCVIFEVLLQVGKGEEKKKNTGES